MDERVFLCWGGGGGRGGGRQTDRTKQKELEGDGRTGKDN